MTFSAAVKNVLTPTGRLRASINLGNPILANRDAAGLPVGVSIDLARELARRLGVESELVVSDSAGKSVDIVNADLADVGFVHGGVCLD
jgi:polar amino acid transport system substrate-binding protein